MNKSLLNNEGFTKALSEQINKAVMDSAEPLIQQALKDIEQKMRMDLAAFLIGSMDTSFTLHDDMLNLTVRLKGK